MLAAVALFASLLSSCPVPIIAAPRWFDLWKSLLINSVGSSPQNGGVREVDMLKQFPEGWPMGQVAGVASMKVVATGARHTFLDWRG